MSAERSPVEMSVDYVLEGLDPHLDAIRDLIAKTDADFIDDDGNFSASLRAGNNAAISGAIANFNEVASDKSFEEAVEEGALSPEELVALGYVFKRNVTLAQWNHNTAGSSLATPLPELVETIEDLKPLFIETVTKVGWIVEWWRNDLPYFANVGAIDRDRSVYGATVYPSKGEANVKVLRDNIIASFENGLQVGVKEREGQPIWISVNTRREALKIPLLGYHHYHATTDDFMGKRYEGYKFLGEQRVRLKGDAGRFATRIALELMAPNEQEIDVALPSQEYSEQIIDLLADSTVAAFNRASLHAEVNHARGAMTGYSVRGVDVYRASNLVRSSTENRLKAFLHGAGASVVDLSSATDTKLQANRRSENLGSRIDAIRTQSDIDEFLDTLS